MERELQALIESPEFRRYHEELHARRFIRSTSCRSRTGRFATATSWRGCSGREGHTESAADSCARSSSTWRPRPSDASSVSSFVAGSTPS